MTDVIAKLHTTLEYKAAALQLMMGEAGFVASQIQLPEVPTDENKLSHYGVSPPPEGVGGYLVSGDYSFSFRQGRLESVCKGDWFQKISPPVSDFLELAQRPSAFDAGGAYSLASAWLAAISVDVGELESRSPVVVFQVPGRLTDGAGRELWRVSTTKYFVAPLFRVGWGSRPPNALRVSPRMLPDSVSSWAFVEILGTTKELVELRINNPVFLKRPRLHLPNADELLGPLPPPRRFVEKLVGGTDAYETIEKPDKVEAWLLRSAYDSDGHREKLERAGPVKLTVGAAKDFAAVLLDFDSYIWCGPSKKCKLDCGARLGFRRGNDSVDVHLCYECDILRFTHQGRSQLKDFGPARDALVRAIQGAFPEDKVVKNLRLRHPNRA